MTPSFTAPEGRTLAFVDADRTFTCKVAPRHRTEATLWWWFSVSGGNASRYAPFMALPEDTDDAVQARILAYYEEHLARRAAPPVNRWRRPAT